MCARLSVHHAGALGAHTRVSWVILIKGDRLRLDVGSASLSFRGASGLRCWMRRIEMSARGESGRDLRSRTRYCFRMKSKSTERLIRGLAPCHVWMESDEIPRWSVKLYEAGLPLTIVHA